MDALKQAPPVEPTQSSHLAEAFRWQLLRKARRSLALRRQFPGCVVRYRRASTKGPNPEFALVAVIKPDQLPVVEVWPFSKIDGYASGISQADAIAELFISGRRAEQEEE